MSLNSHHEGPQAKLIYMANQIAKFMESKPHSEGLDLFASHINDFWEPPIK
jgi:formate dehydrogenase subunit delta